MNDHCTHAGAIALARRIEAFWAEQGYLVAVELANASQHGTSQVIWSIRSSLVMGLPPGYRGPIARQVKPETEQLS